MPRVIRAALARLRGLFRRDATADEIRDELEFHVAMRTDEYARSGLEIDAARRAALRRFGNLAVIRDRGYDERGGGVMETVLQDLKYAQRQLRDQPSFAILAVLTLGLGIGVTTALFSVIDAALLRPLPYPHPDELVSVLVEETRAGKPSRLGPSMEDIRAWRRLETTVSQAGMGRVSGFVPLIVDPGVPQRLIVGDASDGFLETYGVAPILGRGFGVDDTREGAPLVALLGHAFWHSTFGGDATVVGRHLRVENEPATIVGVLPAGFYEKTAVWRVRQFEAAMLGRRGSGTPVIARLRPGVDIARAQIALDAVTAPAAATGGTQAVARVVIQSLYDNATRGFDDTIRTLSLAVGLILAIACVNVAGLMLARGGTRQVELAIRAAIGAGRSRLIRQLLTESLLLAASGALVGVVCAYLFLDALVALVPLALPANSPPMINATVLAFALGLTVVTALLFGLVPALRLSLTPKTMSAMFGVGSRGGAPMSRRAGQWLIGVEVALAVVLLTGAGLILRSFARMVAVDLGYDTANVLTLEVEPLDRSAAVRRDYYSNLVDALRSVPEVAAAGAIDWLSLGGGGSFAFPKADTGEGIEGPQRTILPGYFEALGVRATAGRLLEDADRGLGEAVVVNTTSSRRYFAGAAVGHTLRMGDRNQRLLRIVGVVPDIRHSDPRASVQPEMYILPNPRASESSELHLAMVVRLRDGMSPPLARLKEMAESIGPRVLTGKLLPAEAIVSKHVDDPRRRMVLLSLLGVFGLLLTLVGIFSMTAYAVTHRTREIGIRMAFGARPTQVVGAMVHDAVLPVALGLVVGLASTYYATSLIASFLFETTPYDPATLVVVVVLVATAACLAAWLPARRAAVIDPVVALRSD